MDIVIPVEFEEIVDEITRYTGIPRNDVKLRTWQEAINFGWNVKVDISQFKVELHQYSEQMKRLYQEGTGLIFETLVSWATPARQKWIQQALERIQLFQSQCGGKNIRILMLGDGAGNDSLFLAKHGLRVDYFDLPGSKTYEFAAKRFGGRGLLGERVRMVSNYAECLSGNYNVVVCFEVLEHVPEPVQTIRDLGQMLTLHGIALVTEAFGSVREDLPTHLRMNLRYEGKTPFLFLKNGMRLSWYSQTPRYKPMEFTKVERVNPAMYLELLEDGSVVKDLLRASMMPIIRRVRFWGSH